MATPLNLSVMKAFDVLELFSAERSELTSDFVANEMVISYATAHRFLVTLEAAAAVTIVRRGVFAPGPRLVSLGRMAENLAPLPAELPAILDKLRVALDESVMACRFNPRGPICVAVSPSQRPISVNIKIGTTLPMLNTAQGRLFLAHMSTNERASWVKSQGVLRSRFKEVEGKLDNLLSEGYATNLGDNEPDIAAVSVPVLNNGVAVFTLSTFGMLSRMDTVFVQKAKRLLTQAAKEVSN